jgi:hypothetical protein
MLCGLTKDDAPPSSLMDSTVSPKVNNERRRSWGALPGLQHFEGRRVCWSSGMGLGRLTSNSIAHTDLHIVGALWCMDEPQPNLGKATTFPLIIYFMLGHGTSTQMSFCPGIPKWEFRNYHN